MDTELSEYDSLNLNIEEKPWPPLFRLQPYEKDSGDIECLSSLICRTAEAHCTPPRALLNRIAYWDDFQSNSKPRRITYKGLHAVNGSHSVAKLVSGSLETLSGAKNRLACTTLLPWKGFIEPKNRGLRDNHMKWCPQCWELDRLLDRDPYNRLYWTLLYSTVCVHHETVLVSKCFKCGNKQNLVPQYSQQWVCQSCDQDLTQGQLSIQKLSKENLWKSRAMQTLVRRLNHAEFGGLDRSVTESLEQLESQWRIEAFALDSEPARLRYFLDNISWYKRSWRNGAYLPTFLTLCYLVDIPPDVLLLNQPSLTSSAFWREGEFKRYIHRSAITVEKKTKLKIQLLSALKEQGNDVVFAGKIARDLDISVSAIKYHFPELYLSLRERTKETLRKRSELRMEERLKRLNNAIHELVRQGETPSYRKLLPFEGIIPSDLRRKEIKQVLKKYR